MNLQLPEHPENGNPVPLPFQFDAGLAPLRPEHLNFRRSRSGEHFLWDNQKRLLPNGTPFCILQASLEGRGFFHSPKNRQALTPGKFFIAPVPSPTAYGMHKDASWSWIFLVISGEVALSLVNRINAAGGYVFDHERYPFFIPKLNRWYDALLNGNLPEAVSFAAETFQLLLTLHAAIRQRDPGNRFVRELREAIERHYGDPSFRITKVAVKLGTTPFSLARAFRTHTGTSPREALKARRLEAATTLLIENDLSIKEIAYRVGYSSPAALSNAFKSVTGKPPRAMRGHE